MNGKCNNWGLGSVMMHSPEMTSGDVSLFLGSSRADMRDHSMCLHSGVWSSVKSLPLYLCPPWLLDVPTSIKENCRGCKRFSALFFFSFPFKINVCCVKETVSQQTQMVLRVRWGRRKKKVD